MFLKFSLLALVTSFSALAFSQNSFITQVGVNTKTFYGTTDSLNVAKSNVDLNFAKLIQDAETIDGKITHIFQFQVQVSAVPTLLKSSTQDKLNQILETKIEIAEGQLAAGIAAANAQVALGHQALESGISQARAAGTASINQMILAQIQANPDLRTLSPEAQQAFFLRVQAQALTVLEQQLAQARLVGETKLAVAVATIEATRSQTQAQINLVRQEKRDEIDSRLNHLQLETTFQQVAVSYTRVNEHKDGNISVVFLEVGKLEVKGSNDKSSDLLATNDRTEALTSTVGTGAIHFGYATTYSQVKIKNSKDLATGTAKVSVDAYIFHNRLPFIDGTQLVADIVSLSEDRYRDHLRFYQLNTALLKMMYETKQITLYVTGAKGSNVWWAGAGADIRFRQGFALMIRGYAGHRDQGTGSVSTYLSKKFETRIAGLTFYFGPNYTKGQHSVAYKDGIEFSEFLIVTGVKITPKGRLASCDAA